MQAPPSTHRVGYERSLLDSGIVEHAREHVDRELIHVHSCEVHRITQAAARPIEGDAAEVAQLRHEACPGEPLAEASLNEDERIARFIPALEHAHAPTCGIDFDEALGDLESVVIEERALGASRASCAV